MIKLDKNFLIKRFYQLDVIETRKLKINENIETYKVVSNKKKLFANHWPIHEIFVSKHVLKWLTEKELISSICHERYHKYHFNNRLLENRFEEILHDKTLTLFKKIKITFLWNEEIKADLFSTLESEGKSLETAIDKLLKHKMKSKNLIDSHPPWKIRRWIIRKYGFTTGG